MRRAALAIACVALACEATGFEPEYVVDTLRVLGITADAPFAAPGQSVHFATTWADPLGAGRTIQWAWGTCLNPGSSQIPDCANALDSLAPGTDSFDITVPANALDGVVVGEVGVVFAACAGTLSLVRDPHNGAPVTCKDLTGAPVGRDGFVWGGTRVVVTTLLVNANPSIDKIFIDGTEWAPGYSPAIDSCVGKNVDDCPASAVHEFSYTAKADSAETYDIGAGPTTEELVGWFYVTQGSLTAGYASPNADDAGVPLSPPRFDIAFVPTTSDRSHPLHLWFVLRDDRGGMSIADRQITWK